MKSLIDLLYPPVCAGCGEILCDALDGFCPVCRQEWREEKSLPCPVCGEAQFHCRCRIPISGDYRADFPHLPPNGIAQVHLSAYQPGRNTVTGRMILRAKSKQFISYREIWGRELGACIATVSEGEPAVVTWVPRKPAKARVSGTDQARWIADGVGKTLSLPIYRLLLRRGGSDQKKKSAAMRFESQKDRYRLAKGAEKILKGKTIILVDDVITTGASVMACADLLYGAGARTVLAAAVARTYRKKMEEQDEKENCD